MKINASKVLRIYVAAVCVITVVGLLYVYLLPPASMQTDRDGVAHLTPKVLHPDTGDTVELSTLIRHYRGD